MHVHCTLKEFGQRINASVMKINMHIKWENNADSRKPKRVTKLMKIKGC